MSSRAVSLLMPVSFYWPDDTPASLKHGLDTLNEAALQQAGLHLAERLRIRISLKGVMQFSTLFIQPSGNAPEKWYLNTFQRLPNHIDLERVYCGSCAIFVEKSLRPPEAGYWRDYFANAHHVAAYALGHATLGQLTVPINSDSSAKH